MNTRITQKTVANHLGIDISTVCKALRGDPQIAAATRQRVNEAAQNLGYRRDPMLAALANHRRGLKTRPYQACIAWIHNHARDVDMGIFPGYHEYYEGAQHRAKALGYGIEAFYIDDKRMTANRLAGILQARNIQCLVAAPQATTCGTLLLPWQRLCAISIGYTLREPALNLVTNDHFATMSEMLQRLRSRSYRRIGCYLSVAENERMGRRASSAFHAYSKECRVKVEMFQKFQPEKFLRWLRTGRFDAVIAPGSETLSALHGAGLHVPDDMGLAGYALSSSETIVSGMSHNNQRIGELAIDVLCRAFEHGEFGIPEQPIRILVPPRWLENTTLRPA